jgi:hypothetical protein
MVILASQLAFLAENHKVGTEQTANFLADF